MRSSSFLLFVVVLVTVVLSQVVCVMARIQSGIDIHWDTLKIVLGSY